jgi:S1-C subfamily serine protease
VARVLGADRVADVALLKIAIDAPDGVTVAPLGDSDTVRIGDRVFVIGAPLGLTDTLSVGYVSARRPGQCTIPSLVQSKLLQTDAAINQGNSGGPMFNMRGEVVGVVSHLVTRTGDNSGLGFAVSSNTARELLLERPAFWSGSESTLITGELARALNTPDGRPGLLVERVAAGSPADAIGLRPGSVRITVAGREMMIGGDIVLSVMGIDIGPDANHEQIRLRLSELKPGDEMTMVVLREGKVESLSKRRRSN